MALGNQNGGGKTVRKIILVLAFFCFSSAAFANFEIQISGWELKNEFVTPLIPDANSEDLGRVIYKTYERESPRAILEIIITEGTGTGNLYVPENVNASKGLMPASEYKILEINGHRAIFESPEFLPAALAVNAGENLIINLESSSLSQEELIEIAGEILKE